MDRISLKETCAGLLDWLEATGTKPGDSIRRSRVTGLSGGARSVLLAEVARRLERPLVAVLPDAEAAEALAGDLRFLLAEGAEAAPHDRRVHYLPGWEVPVFDEVSPAREVVGARMLALYSLIHTGNVVLVTTPEGLAQRVMPRVTAPGGWLYLVERETQRPEEVTAFLAGWGYHRVPAVQDLGEYSVRGGILDVYPCGYANPVRLEFVGDTIEDIRDFVPATQRSGASREDLLLLPIQEYNRDRLVQPITVRRVEDRAAEMGLTRRDGRRWTDALHAGFGLPGTEFLLPYLYDGLESVAAYLPQRSITCVVDPGGVRSSVQAFQQRVESRAAEIAEGSLPAPPSDALYLTPEEIHATLLDRDPVVEIDVLQSAGAADGVATWCIASRSNHGLAINPAWHGREASLGSLAAHVREWHRMGLGLMVIMSATAQAERLRSLLAVHDLELSVRGVGFLEALALLGAGRGAPAFDGVDGVIICGELSAGVHLPADRLVVLTEEEIFGERRAPQRTRRSVVASFLTSLAELKPDDYVVHLDHGVGIYRGLRHLQVASTAGDYLHVEYAGGDRLYLPVDRINLIERYTGSDGKVPPLDKLGSGGWERVKKRARESILSMARELIDVHAAREIVQRTPVAPGDGYFHEFEARFPFEATPDQRSAIEDVLTDMQRPKPMDRLVCGDVGYGKTEVAMRAAFLAVMDGSQVAALVPTTVLAQQHLATFRERFASYPMRVEMLSRFRSPKENRAVIEALGTGAVDIVIGTHRLLQKDVHFRKLGLLIVDEEHRFGVADKERIKRLRTELDVLTLTATPIPRTMQLSLSGMRDLSVIETPPLDRLAIRTYVARFDDHIVCDAIRRELSRGGQVFFVHNRVETIDAMSRWVAGVVPEARVAVGHGQMRERQLEEVMRGFLAHETDILVCSAIIESGLDIPRANTIIINRADTFGLAQLYQLRGRVGRSHHRAYAYLLIPGEHLISKDAQKRLRVLRELDDLGSGFRLAAHDLEIRGAGNLLGRRQSGQIAAVGLELYMRMLEEVVLELRGTQRRVEIDPEVQLGIPAFIPEGYVADVSQRLVLYKRMASVATREQLEEIDAEMQDRFGPLPPPVDTLLQIMDLRRHLKALLVTRARRRGNQLLFEFHPDTPVEAERLLASVGKSEGNCRMVGEYRLSLSMRARDVDGMLTEAREWLQSIARPC